MKKMVAITLTVLLCAIAMTVQAGHKSKKVLSPEQQAVQKEMLDKYDTNKDGKLDKDELAKVSQEDQDKMAKAGLTKHHKQDGAPDAAPKAPDDNAGE